MTFRFFCSKFQDKTQHGSGRCDSPRYLCDSWAGRWFPGRGVLLESFHLLQQGLLGLRATHSNKSNLITLWGSRREGGRSRLLRWLFHAWWSSLAGSMWTLVLFYHGTNLSCPNLSSNTLFSCGCERFQPCFTFHVASQDIELARHSKPGPGPFAHRGSNIRTSLGFVRPQLFTRYVEDPVVVVFQRHHPLSAMVPIHDLRLRRVRYSGVLLPSTYFI